MLVDLFEPLKQFFKLLAPDKDIARVGIVLIGNEAGNRHVGLDDDSLCLKAGSERLVGRLQKARVNNCNRNGTLRSIVGRHLAVFATHSSNLYSKFKELEQISLRLPGSSARTVINNPMYILEQCCHSGFLL